MNIEEYNDVCTHLLDNSAVSDETKIYPDIITEIEETRSGRYFASFSPQYSLTLHEKNTLSEIPFADIPVKTVPTLAEKIQEEGQWREGMEDIEAQEWDYRWGDISCQTIGNETYGYLISTARKETESATLPYKFRQYGIRVGLPYESTALQGRSDIFDLSEEDQTVENPTEKLLELVEGLDNTARFHVDWEGNVDIEGTNYSGFTTEEQAVLQTVEFALQDTKVGDVRRVLSDIHDDPLYMEAVQQANEEVLEDESVAFYIDEEAQEDRFTVSFSTKQGNVHEALILSTDPFIL